MVDVIRQEAVYLWYYFDVQLRQIFWYWVLGMVIGFLVSVFLKDRVHDTSRSLGDRRLGVLGIFAASALGIASPLCMYGTIPIAASFSRSGIRDDWLAAFMMSSVLLNPQLIIYSVALGPAALAVRVSSSFLCGAVAGLLVRWVYRDKGFFRFEEGDICFSVLNTFRQRWPWAASPRRRRSAVCPSPPSPSRSKRWRRSWAPSSWCGKSAPSR